VTKAVLVVPPVREPVLVAPPVKEVVLVVLFVFTGGSPCVYLWHALYVLVAFNLTSI